MQYDYVQEGVGHYGVFNGRRFKSEIYPRQKQFIRTYFSADKERQFLAAG
jgi:poly(3-hydroxybutyrate) depolymerase